MGLIFDIQRFSIHDGPGIRSAVFLKGCPLSCLWCHNPESISCKPEIAFYSAKCIGCMRCVETCAYGAIIAGDGHVDRIKCQTCGECAKLCPAEAVQKIGRTATVSEVVDVVMRDEPFYKTSEGGVTLTGGEPLHQYEFLLALLKAFKVKGLHTAVDTCGLASWDKIAGLSALTDLFLYDLKVVDLKKHKKLCGADNSVILDNARRLTASGANIVFRTPLVPGINDAITDLRSLGEFILSLPGEQKLELLPYHHIGCGKYEALGINYSLPNLQPLDSIDEHKQTLKDIGIKLHDVPSHH